MLLALVFAWTEGLNARADSGAGAEFDRLDGRGKSRKRVDVIEWEGNLEIHVYPKGSLVGLGLKIDRRDRDKPVMVINYRFDHAPKTPLTRRAILSIPLRDGFHAFRDPDVDGYDKVIISNHDLSHALAAFQLDPEPEHLYPEEHPNRQVAADKNTAEKKSRPSPKPQDGPGPALDEHGTIRPFSW